MADPPQIKVKGAGSNREAARLGQTIGDAVVSALGSPDRSVRIDRLRLQLPAGASRAEIERAIRHAIAREQSGRRR